MASTKGWTLDGILSQGSNFEAVHRVSVMSDTLSQTIEKYDLKGIPLVIEDFHKDTRWPQHMFTLDEFVAGTSPNIQVRNVHNCIDSTIPVGDFISQCRISSVYRTPEETARYYGKDAECPKDWELWLQNGGVVPKTLLSKGTDDLFRCRPENAEAAVETLMCYLGIGDTFTPCHKDLCASSGQNLMCYTERDGSSFWFMTESSSAPAVAEYFREKLGQELDHENYVATIEEWSNAPVKVYVLQQRLGDMVLVPPRSCHQVMNSGGITVKTSWSRMTLTGLLIAYYYELSIYRRVGRPETYRIKSTIHHAMSWMTTQFQDWLAQNQTSGDHPTSDALLNDLKILLSLYDCILVEEYESNSAVRKKVVYQSDIFNDDNRLVCDFCSADIFQSFFECRKCCDSEDEPCQLCPGCYAEGRDCYCGEMKPMQYQRFQHLIDARTRAADAIKSYHVQHDRTFDNRLALNKPNTCFVNVFKAACILNRNRTDFKRIGKICKWKAQAHEVNLHWTVNCKKCHNGKCFPHLLESSRMHSTEALLYQSSDASHERYHHQHQTSKKRFDTEIDSVRQRLTLGLPLQGSMYHILVDLATNCRNPRPRNLKYVTYGWYDIIPIHFLAIAATQLPTLALTSTSPATSFERSLSHESTDSTIVSQMETTRCISPLPSQRRTSRKHSMYVDVPTAPYTTVYKGKHRTIAVHEWAARRKTSAFDIHSPPQGLEESEESLQKMTAGKTLRNVTGTSSQAHLTVTSSLRVPTVKIGPPIGVAPAVKRPRLPTNTFNGKVPSAQGDVHPLVLVSSLPILLNSTGTHRLLPAGGSQQNCNPPSQSSAHLSSPFITLSSRAAPTSRRFGDSGYTAQGSSRKRRADSDTILVGQESLKSKKVKRGRQSMEGPATPASKNSQGSDIRRDQGDFPHENMHPQSLWTDQVRPWNLSYNIPALSATSASSTTAMKWSTQGVDTPKITLPSLHVQDYECADLVHSPTTPSQSLLLLPDSTVLDGEIPTYDTWADRSFMDGNDIDFDNLLFH